MDYHFLSGTPLFRGASPEDIRTMLGCLQPRIQSYSKGSVIYHAGDTVTAVGLVLSGRVSIENDDIWGNKSILDHVGPGQVFAETYACVPGEPLMISAVAAQPCEILFLETSRVLHICSNACGFHPGDLGRILS